MGALEGFIFPALETGNLRIAANCEVVHLDASTNSVKNVTVKQEEKLHNIPVQSIVLAAGAYFTPVVLLRSTNQHWPNGLANYSDMVGRNLMFHATDYIGIWSMKRYSLEGVGKTLAFRDFYCDQGEKLGQLQSAGRSASMGYILYFLRLKVDTSIVSEIPILNKLVRQ